MGSVHFSNYNSANLGIPSTDIGIPLPTSVYLYRHPIGNGDNIFITMSAHPWQWGQFYFFVVGRPIGNGDNFITTSSADPLAMGTIYLLHRRPTHCQWSQYIYYIVGPPIANGDNIFSTSSADVCWPISDVTLSMSACPSWMELSN